VWLARVGRIPLLLLDSDIEDNQWRGPARRPDRLYGGDQDHRIRQEILAGIGGVRAVRRYCEVTGHPEPAVSTPNEGHAGFLGLDGVRELMPSAALASTRRCPRCRAARCHNAHPLAAGIDRFPVDMVEHYFFGHGRLLPGLPVERILSLGAEENQGMFQMAHWACGWPARQRVSKLHGEVSQRCSTACGRGRHERGPIGSVTNGVHGPTWAAVERWT